MDVFHRQDYEYNSSSSRAFNQNYYVSSDRGRRIADRPTASIDSMDERRRMRYLDKSSDSRHDFYSRHRRSISTSPERTTHNSLSSGDSTSDSLPYSAYYRSRFGTQSPEEYQNLRFTNLAPEIPD